MTDLKIFRQEKHLVFTEIVVRVSYTAFLILTFPDYILKAIDT